MPLRRQPRALAAALAALAFFAPAARASTPAAERARRIAEDVRAASFPELAGVELQVREFSSESDYFRSRFDLRRFATGRRMRYVLFVNPRVFALGAPEDGVRAIMAHELAHVVYYRRASRLRLLGLVRLAGPAFRSRFERWADLQALSRGYAAGLRAYRVWLYAHVSGSSLAEKRRDYFSPEEIDAIDAAGKARPGSYDDWFRRVPRSLREIAPPARAPSAAWHRGTAIVPCGRPSFRRSVDPNGNPHVSRLWLAARPRGARMHVVRT